MMLGYRGQHGDMLMAGARWVVGPAGRGDSADVKRLFLHLHLYNGSLDPHFALAEDWEEHFDPILAQALAGEGKRRLLLARDRTTGRAIGFILAALHEDGALWKHRTWVEIEALYVERAWRGTGLAEALLAPIGDWARDLGQARVQLYVTHANERAIRFYEGQGFRPTQAIMRKALPAG